MTNRSLRHPFSRVRGYTLTELMITVAVLAIIVGIAVPGYNSQMQKSRRADARNALLDIAGREERYLSVSNGYSQLTTDVGYSGAWPQNVNNGYYSVSVQAPDPAQPGVTSFIITATAINAQASDTACATFTLTQTGVQGSAPGTPATCWGN